MDITAFGETKPLEQHLWDVANSHRNLLDQGYTDLLLLAYAKLEFQKRQLKEAQERDARLLERLDRLEKAVVPQERRWLVKGTIEQLSREGDQQWEESRIVIAPTQEEAERLFAEHWERTSKSNSASYYATVTHCSSELAKE
jgi:hypothetical protein